MTLGTWTFLRLKTSETSLSPWPRWRQGRRRTTSSRPGAHPLSALGRAKRAGAAEIRLRVREGPPLVLAAQVLRVPVQWVFWESAGEEEDIKSDCLAVVGESDPKRQRFVVRHRKPFSLGRGSCACTLPFSCRLLFMSVDCGNLRSRRPGRSLTENGRYCWESDSVVFAEDISSR